MYIPDAMMEINKTQFFEKVLKRYNELDAIYDRLWDKLNKMEEAKDDKDRIAAISVKMDLVESEQTGMVNVLEMMGYTIHTQKNAQYQDEFVIVER